MSFINTRFYKLRRPGLALVFLALASVASAKNSLIEHYHQLKTGNNTTLPGMPINIASIVDEERLDAEVNSIVTVPFEVVATELTQARNWCEILPLHFNIKTCTYDRNDGADHLTVYSGRKIYESPDDSYRMRYQFEVLQHDEQQLSLRLHADDGPVGTSDYLIELQAIPVAEGTLLHMHSSYRPGWLSSMLTSAYLATVGSGKVGFSQVEQDGELHPVEGIRGIIERNVMRYQIAIKAFFNTRTLPQDQRHEAALLSWFAQSEQYAQLHEMDEKEYLEIKHREWNNQKHLQQMLDQKLQLVVNP